MAKKSRVRILKEQFIARLLPELEKMGLSKNPSNNTDFGGVDFGYRYSLADIANTENVRLCDVFIIPEDLSIIIEAVKGVVLPGDLDALPTVLRYNSRFRLSRPSTLREFFTRFGDARFKLEQKRNESVESAAARLCDDILKELPKLQRYLYG